MNEFNRLEVGPWIAFIKTVMRTYTFKRICGHTTRGKRKLVSLTRPCLDCMIDKMQFMTDEQKVIADREFNLLDSQVIKLGKETA